MGFFQGQFSGEPEELFCKMSLSVQVDRKFVQREGDGLDYHVQVFHSFTSSNFAQDINGQKEENWSRGIHVVS